MKILQNRYARSITAIILLLAGGLLMRCPVQAAAHNIAVKNGENLTIPVYTGDTGTFAPDMSTIVIPEENNKEDDSSDTDYPLPPTPGADVTTEEESPSDPSTDKPDDPTNPADNPDDSEDYLDSLHFEYDYNNDNNLVTFDSQTNIFTALHPGNMFFTIHAYEPDDYWHTNPVFTATVTLVISVDMTNVTLSESTLTAYISPQYSYGKKKPYYNNSYAEFQIAINSAYIFNADPEDRYPFANYSDDSLLNYSYTNTSHISMDVSMSNNIIYVSAYAEKSVTSLLTITLSGKTFLITVNISPLGISDQSYLLVKGKKKALKVTGANAPVQWYSTNPKVATVNAKGVVKGKKIGNCVIIGKLGNAYVGCAVSVTTAKLKKVATYARYMGTHWTYSQAKRTQNGYYDCSALVWKAYKKYTNINFGSAGYPGVALTEAKWCNAHHRMIKGGFRYKKSAKMLYNPGDLIFKSSNMKKKYQDIYHVEMITGYYCYGVSSDGVPYVAMTWGARDPGYSTEEGSLLARPMK